MNDDSLSKIFSFETTINENGDINIPFNNLKNLFQNGYRNVTVEIYGDSQRAIEISENDISVFNKIISIQSLPQNDVLGFLNSKGSLNEDDIRGIL